MNHPRGLEISIIDIVLQLQEMPALMVECITHIVPCGSWVVPVPARWIRSASGIPGFRFWTIAFKIHRWKKHFQIPQSSPLIFHNLAIHLNQFMPNCTHEYLRTHIACPGLLPLQALTCALLAHGPPYHVNKPPHMYKEKEREIQERCHNPCSIYHNPKLKQHRALVMVDWIRKRHFLLMLEVPLWNPFQLFIWSEIWPPYLNGWITKKEEGFYGLNALSWEFENDLICRCQIT